MLLRRSLLLALAALGVASAEAMEQSQVPTHFPVPWGNSAGTPYINNIPEASQIGVTNCAASLTDGFPPLTFVPASAGGCPPFGKDFNGILRQITQWSRWQGAGAAPLYNSSFSSSIGGYPSGAIVANASTVGCYWVSTIDNNASNPDTGGGNWTSSCPGGGFGGVSTGSANAQAVTTTPFRVVTGAVVQFVVGFTNTSGATLDVNGGGLVGLRKPSLAGLVALTGNELVAGQIIKVVYDGTFYQVPSQVSPVGTWASAAGGTANAITLTVGGASTVANLTGIQISFIAGSTNTGATTIIVNGIGVPSAIRKPTLGGNAALAGCEIIAGQVVTVLYNDVTGFILLTLPQPSVPTQQVLLSGTGATYTTPACARQIRIRMVGGGGGGGAAITNAGTVGTATVFNSIQAGAGGGGLSGSVGNTGGLGGVSGVGAANLRIPGGDGMNGGLTSAIVLISGGQGGSSAFGGAGRGGFSGAGQPAKTNSGSGGGAAGAASGSDSGGGGGSGEYVELVINSPASSYTYTVGAGGAGGAAGTSAGGAGAAGIVIVTEIY